MLPQRRRQGTTIHTRHGRPQPDGGTSPVPLESSSVLPEAEIRISIERLPAMVPIRTADGRLVENLTTPPDWRDLKHATGAPSIPIDFDAILAEEHHRVYGRPWVIGRCYFDELVARNLQPTNRVLDLGCGAGRVGIWLIPFLNSGNYYGIETHLGTLAAFAAYECVIHNLRDKQPHLMLDDEFRVEGFGVRFDVVLDFNVSVHVPMDARVRLFQRVAASCNPGARLFMSRKPKVPPAVLCDVGFELVAHGDVEYAMLHGWPAEFATKDRWYEYRLAR